VTGKRGRGRKQLSDGLKETKMYQKLKEVTLERSLGRTRPGRGYVNLSQGGILFDETPDNSEDDCNPGLDERIIWLVTRSNSLSLLFFP
jgi:hypothetical protein